jgi:hypothetical protein
MQQSVEAVANAEHAPAMAADGAAHHGADDGV